MEYGSIRVLGNGICNSCPCCDLFFTPGGVRCEHEFACKRILDRYSGKDEGSIPSAFLYSFLKSNEEDQK